MPIQLKAAALSDKGRTRDVNEDTVFQKVVSTPDEDSRGLLIAADGIGGRLAGAVASYWAVETIKDSLADLFSLRDPRDTAQFSRKEILDAVASVRNNHDTGRFDKVEIASAEMPSRADQAYLTDRVRAAVNRANGVIRQYASAKLEKAGDAGTTIAMAVVQGPIAVIANVGDSRVYRLRNGEMRQITKDHSVVQRMVDAGMAQPEQVYTHPSRNLIYRSLGADDSVKVDIFAPTIAPGDYLLLCTDGLWEMVQSPVKIAEIVFHATSLDAACTSLVQAANAAGGEDNIGVVLAQAYE
jgi:protein phosphatase